MRTVLTKETYLHIKRDLIGPEMTNQGRPSARFFCGSMNTVTDESEVYTRAIRFYPLVHIRRRDRTPSLRPSQKPKAVKHGLIPHVSSRVTHED